MALRITCPYCSRRHELAEPYPLPGSDLHCWCGAALSISYPAGLMERLRKRGIRFQGDADGEELEEDAFMDSAVPKLRPNQHCPSTQRRSRHRAGSLRPPATKAQPVAPPLESSGNPASDLRRSTPGKNSKKYNHEAKDPHATPRRRHGGDVLASEALQAAREYEAAMNRRPQQRRPHPGKRSPKQARTRHSRGQPRDHCGHGRSGTLRRGPLRTRRHR